MFQLKPSSLSIKKHLSLLILLIFAPVLIGFLITVFRQYQQAIKDFETDTKRFVNLFIEEQVNISARTHQLLSILSHVPAVNDLDIPQCNQILQSIYKETPQYSTIVVANGEGLIDCCAIPLEKTIDISDRSWFHRINKDRDFVIDNYLISRTSQKASLPFAYPIFDKDGNLKVAIGAALDLSYYSELFNKIDTPKAYEITLTDRTGVVLYQSSSDSGCLGKSLTECNGFNVPPSESKKKSFDVTDPEGIDRTYMFEWLQIGQDNNEICFLVSISKKEMFSTVLVTLFTSLTAVIITVTVSLLIAWYFGKRLLVNPINSLVQKTKDIKHGAWNLSQDNRDLPKELEMLSTAFDEMVLDLSEKENERDKALAEARNELQVRTQIEKELSESEQHLKVIFESAADPIYVSDLNGRLHRVNTAACKATGYNEEELLQSNIIDIDANLSSDEELNNLFASISPGKQVTHTSVHCRKDGTTFPVEITISRIKTTGGDELMGIARDITERIQLEERSKQTQRLESVGRLAGGVAHDLNNLLTPILGYGELVINDNRTLEETKTKIQHILKAGTGARDLVKQLLAFSRKQVLEYKPLNINIVLDGFQNLLRRTIRENIEIKISKLPELPLVMADIGQLEQVIMNLCVNAADAMPEGGTLSIATSTVELDEQYALAHDGVTPGKYAMISFSDTGLGMDKQTTSQIFEPFFSTKGELGTGLGLATVYGIVKQHSGNIWVYSEPGIGTTFKIYLPTLNGVEQSSEKENSLQNKTDNRGSETILLVEDNEQVRRTVYDTLKQQGYKIIQATGGEDALKKISSTDQPVHLLLTDVVMPDMNGKELHEILLKTYPDLKALYMSGYTDDIIVKHGVLNEGIQFIDKPFTGNSILEKVRKVINA